MGILDFLTGGIGSVVSAISKPITQHLTNKGAEAQATHERKLRVISGEQTWEERQAEASNGSWKDEYLTILITIPFIMRFGAVFFGRDAEYAVERAIMALSDMPTEYWYLMSATFAAAFAIKGIPAAVTKIRASKKDINTPVKPHAE